MGDRNRSPPDALSAVSNTRVPMAVPADLGLLGVEALHLRGLEGVESRRRQSDDGPGQGLRHDAEQLHAHLLEGFLFHWTASGRDFCFAAHLLDNHALEPDLFVDFGATWLHMDP